MKFIDRIFVCNGQVAIDVCPNLWENFAPTADPKVRHCGECSRNVHFCDNEKEIMRHANLGHCVAFADADENQSPNVRQKSRVLGRPSWEYYAEQRALDVADTEAIGMNIVEYNDYQDGMSWIPNNVKNELKESIERIENEEIEYRKDICKGKQEVYETYLELGKTYRAFVKKQSEKYSKVPTMEFDDFVKQDIQIDDDFFVQSEDEYTTLIGQGKALELFLYLRQMSGRIERHEHIRLLGFDKEAKIEQERWFLTEYEAEKHNAFESEEAFEAFLKRREERKLILAKQERKSLMYSVLSEAEIARRRCANCHSPVPQWFRNTCKLCGCTKTVDRESLLP